MEMKRMATSLQLSKAAIDQDRAAGGLGRRKLRVKSGDVVTVSLVATNAESPFRIILRFKSGLTIQREVGRFPAASPSEAVRLAWQAIRADKIAEREGWVWVEE